MNKPYDEIKFIALPSATQLADWMVDNGRESQSRALISRYRAQQWRIVQAQRKAATMAAQVMRYNQWRDVNQKYRDRLRDAREKYEDECVSIFSETCTKGL